MQDSRTDRRIADPTTALQAEALGRQAAEAQVATLRAVLDNMTDGVMLFEANGEFLFTNAANYAMNAFPREVYDRMTHVSEAFRWQLENGHVARRHADIEADVAAMMKVFHRPRPFRYVAQRPNGKWLEISWLPLPDGRKLAMHRDITALKAQEALLAQERDAAQQASQAKSTFLAVMSHEIRTPMNGVLGMMEVLEHEGLSGGQRAILGTMRESATALLRILDDILDFSKIEAGRLELEETGFSLSGLVTGVMQTYLPLAAAKHLSLGAEIAPGSDDMLIGDPTRVRQILMNLVSNAVKFTAIGHVRITAATAPLGQGRTRLSLSVQDSGIGLSAAQQTQLFRPFGQGDSSITRRFGGTGLGLSIVRRLVELMGGAIAVDSREGAGASFTVRLDLRVGVAMPAPEPAVEARAPTGGVVLVVDDHPVNREVLQRQLAVLGMQAELAEDAAEALQKWQPGRYALVLTDIHMPGMDGTALAAALRARGVRTPIVAVTANAMKEEQERCLSQGMDGYLAKPITIAQLRDVIDRHAAPLPVVDRGRLAEWLGDDEEAIDALLLRMLETARGSMAEIDAALGQANASLLAASAHRLRGSAAVVGAVGLAGAAGALERAARAGDLVVAEAALAETAAALADVAAGLGQG